jgi:hypothetical protein
VAAGAPGFRGLPRPHQQRLRAAAVFTDTRLLLLLLLAPHAGFQLSSQLGFTWLLVPLGLGASLGLTQRFSAAAAAFADTHLLYLLLLLLLLLLAPHAGFQLSSQLGFTWLLVPLGLGASLGLTSSGLVLQTQGFKHGSALVVCTTAAAASIVAGESV